MGRGIGAAQHVHTTTQLVDDERGMVPVARFAVAMPAVYYLVTLLLQRVNADQLRSAGHQFRIDWHDAQHGITPPPYHAHEQRVDAARPPRRPGHGGGGRLRLHLAAPGRVGRARPRHPVAAPPRPGASAAGSCRSSTCGCPTRPCATASRPATRTGRACCAGGSPCSLAGFLSFAAGVCALFSTGAALVLSDPRGARLPGRHRLGARHRRGDRRLRTKQALGRADGGNRGVARPEAQRPNRGALR